MPRSSGVARYNTRCRRRVVSGLRTNSHTVTATLHRRRCRTKLTRLTPPFATQSTEKICSHKMTVKMLQNIEIPIYCTYKQYFPKWCQQCQHSPKRAVAPYRTPPDDSSDSLQSPVTMGGTPITQPRTTPSGETTRPGKSSHTINRRISISTDQ